MAEWTVREAAQRLRLTPDIVRRRLRAGTLPGEQRTRPQGTQWVVFLDDVPDIVSDDVPQGVFTVDHGTDVARLNGLIEDLQDRLKQSDWRYAELVGLLKDTQATAQDATATAKALTAHMLPAPDGTNGRTERPPRWKFWQRG